MADGANPLVTPLCAQSFRCVFHNIKMILFSQRHNGIHVCGQSVQMHRHNCFGTFGNLSLHIGTVQIPGVLFAVSKHRGCTAIGHGIGSGDIGQSRHNDLIPGANSQSFQRKMQRHGAVAACQCVFRPAKFSKHFFKFTNKSTIGRNPAGIDTFVNILTFVSV